MVLRINYYLVELPIKQLVYELVRLSRKNMDKHICTKNEVCHRNNYLGNNPKRSL